MSISRWRRDSSSVKRPHMYVYTRIDCLLGSAYTDCKAICDFDISLRKFEYLETRWHDSFVIHIELLISR